MKRHLVLISFFLVLLFSCNADCDEIALIFKDQECILKFENHSLDINEFYQGTNPFTNEHCDCRDSFHSYLGYRDYIEIGDTLIKNKGDYFFSIHKKDTVLTVNFKCGGKDYNDSKQVIKM